MNNYFFEDQKESNNHSFDTVIAKHYSIEKAILLKDLKYFCAYKLRNSQLKKGLPLVYYSSAALEGQYNYMSAKSIGRWLNDLIKDGILFTCVANKVKYDRTKSYLVNFKKYNDIKNQLEYDEKLDEKFLKYCNDTITQNGQWITQNEQSNTQNGETIPTQTSTQTPIFLETEKKEAIKIEHKETLNGNQESDNTIEPFIDFTEKSVKFGYLGKCKGLFQTYLNLLTFSEYEDKIIKGIFYSIKDNLTAYNKKQGTNTPIQDKNVLDALKIALQAFTIKPLPSGKMNLVYFRGSLNANVYIKIDDTAKLLDLVGSEQKANYYKIAARDGASIATEKLRNLLTKQGKI
jgi:hypothetical protein